jgi:delta8-fatty-acid desaturase
MMKYKIGRVEGRWMNFIPPIQGGKFRPYVEGQADDATEELEVSSASDSSRAPSPIFDDEKLTVRQRHPKKTNRSNSVSSVSSVGGSSVREEKPDRGLYAFLDVRTNELMDLDLAKYPSLEPEVQDDIVSKYRALNDVIRAEGLYQCNYTAYAFEVARYSFLFGMMLYSVSKGWYAVGALFLGLFWHQLVFSAHDAGHMGITHNFTVDTAIGIVIADFFGGLSLSWWKSEHNVHHIVTNHPEHDPDVQLMPFFAPSHRFLESLTSTFYEHVMTYDAFSKLVLPYQAYLYYPILCFGRFNLYVLSWDHLIRGGGPRKGPAAWIRWAEIVGQAVFWVWYGYGIVYLSIPGFWNRLIFVLISHMATAPLHVQITLSHYAMSTNDMGPDESFPQKMLRTTMDVDCPQWLDWVHGGLQFQAIHHLYPRIPRHNLRRTQKLVQGFCDEVGIPYALYGFVEGNHQVIGRLGEIGVQAAILAKCQAKLAEKSAHEILNGGH